jgi:hypothetical protein
MSSKAIFGVMSAFFYSCHVGFLLEKIEKEKADFSI